MNNIIFAVLFFFSFSSFGFGLDKPVFPLIPPTDIQVIHFNETQDQSRKLDRTKEIFVTKGLVWRAELTKPGTGITVVVFDGNIMHAASNKKDVKSELLDWRIRFKVLFEGLNAKNYKGQRKVRSYDCFYFEDEEDGVSMECFIDSVKKIPRKWVLKTKNVIITDYFYDLNISLPEQAAIFSSDKLKPVLMQKAPIDWGDLK